MKFYLLAVVIGVAGCARNVRPFVPAEHTVIFTGATAEDFTLRMYHSGLALIDGHWTLSAVDLVGLEASLDQFLIDHGGAGKYDWSRYRRQCAGVSIDGRRLIFASYFPESIVPGNSNDEWKTIPWQSAGGGNAFFRVLFDPKEKKAIWCDFNGPY